MLNENAIDLFVKLEFWELYLSNLKFSFLRHRYMWLIIAAFLAVVGSLLVYVGLQDAPDDSWTGFATNIKTSVLYIFGRGSFGSHYRSSVYEEATPRSTSAERLQIPGNARWGTR